MQYQKHSGMDSILSVDIACLRVMLSYHAVEENAYVDIICEFFLTANYVQLVCAYGTFVLHKHKQHPEHRSL